MGNYEHMMGCGANSAFFANKFFTYLRRTSDGKLEAAIGNATVFDVIIRSTDVLLPNADTDYYPFMTYDGSETFAGWKIYLDGLEITDRIEIRSFGTKPTDYDNWLLGNEASLTFDMAGKQNQMLLYNKEVPAANIAYIHNSGAGRVIPEVTFNGYPFFFDGGHY
jgi:hypothetical protein